MKWEGNRESDNVEDRRGSGGGGGMPVFGGRSIGIGTIVIALVTIPRQSRGHSGCEPLKAAVRGR